MKTNYLKQKLNTLSVNISECRKCDSRIRVIHAPLMVRGGLSRIFVIGIEPGNTEIEKGKAFSGAGGKRLMEWLKEGGVGNSEDEIFKKVYFTSICKCKIANKKLFWRAAANCFPYLREQISLLQPEICITLGKEPLKFMFDYDGPLERLVGTILNEADFHQTLFPVLPKTCVIIPLPHPSPLSRWTNSAKNKRLLASALRMLKQEI